jgi:acyl carrier protein
MEEQHRIADLEARIRRVIGEAVGVAPETLDAASPVAQEEGLVGGLHLVQACMAVEEEFQIAIPDEHAERLITLRDFTDYVYCHLTGQGFRGERQGANAPARHRNQLKQSTHPL